MKADPTGHIYDDAEFSEHFQKSVSSRKPTKFMIKTTCKGTEVQLKTAKRYCICQGPSKGQMIQCSKCFSWLHAVCVDITEKDMPRMKKLIWVGPCCNPKEMGALESVVLD